MSYNITRLFNVQHIHYQTKYNFYRNILCYQKQFTNYNGLFLQHFRIVITFLRFNNFYQLALLITFFKTVNRVSRDTARLIPQSSIQEYVYSHIHTPSPTTCSNDVLNNNKPIVFSRKNKASPVVQHPEHVVDKCAEPDCEKKICETPCSEIISSESTEHFTHLQRKATNSEPFSPTDFDGKPKPIYAKQYENPHETCGESANPDRDEKYTKEFQEMIKRNNEKK